ncbi:DUF4097 family beta strand repeat-containing protein [Solimonas variicoloris]|uniref:DUF4097 family beta strand repeat-containing protein n=1 Tax=Solimonas variicoloris TaxID=254408 RepID=UPI00038107CE|nr:DUF4097 family beta strand repeat-containing protein [Solimonas variicoloris]
MKMHLPMTLAAGLLLAAGPALARDGSPINETRALAADGQISVNNMAGTITVRGWDRNEVAISGTLGEDAEKLEIGGDAKNLSINVRYPGGTRGHVDQTYLELRVPARAGLRLDAVSADISVGSTSGPIAARSVSGDVQLNVGSGEVNASTVSGDLTVKAPSFKTTLNSVSGDLTASGVRGTLKAETVSGQLSIEGGAFRDVSLQSVSGDMSLDLSLEDAAKLSAETLSGDIDLRLPKTPSAQLTMKTFSGDLHNAFTGGDAGSDVRKVSTTLGGGRGSIDLHTFSGDIRIEPR